MAEDRITENYRKQLPLSVKITGRTIRFKGLFDINAAARFFEHAPSEIDRLKSIDLTDVYRTHTNAIVPVLAFLSRQKKKLKVRCVSNPWVDRVLNMYGYRRCLERDTYSPPLNQSVFHFATDGVEAHNYVNLVVSEILERARQVGQDVAESLEWSLSELIGNVFHHAESPDGAFVQFLVQPGQSRVLFSLADSGIGLLASLKANYPNLKDDKEAIELAIQRGVTSKRDNQGWGLFGSTAIIRSAGFGGKFLLWSGSHMLELSATKHQFHPMPHYQGTVISWILPTDVELDLGKLLESPNRAGSLLLEAYEHDIGIITMKLAYEASYFGDRPTGKKLRNKLLNLVKNSNAKCCVIDFGGVRLITNSFADEFLGKTAYLFGKKFTEQVRVTNLTDINRAIAEVAISERLATEKKADQPMRITTRR